MLEVSVSDASVFEAELAQQVRPADLEWVLDTLSDGRTVICIELPTVPLGARGGRGRGRSRACGELKSRAAALLYFVRCAGLRSMRNVP